MGELAGVHESKGDAGEDGAEDESGGGVAGGELPLAEAGGGAVEGEPVVGGGKGRKKEAAEGNLFGEWGEDDAEGGEEPGSVGGAHDAADAVVFRGGDEVVG